MSNLSQKELYAKLLTLKKPIEAFKKTNSATLTAEEVELMKDVYNTVQIFTSGAMALRLNVGCSSCIREAFHVFVSVFDRLDKDPTVNTDLKEQGITEPSRIDTTDYSDQLNVNGLQGAANLQADQGDAVDHRYLDRSQRLKELGFALMDGGDIFVHQTGDMQPIQADLVRNYSDDDFNAGIDSLVYEINAVRDNNNKETDAERDARLDKEAAETNGNVLVEPPVFDPSKEPAKEKLLKGMPLNTTESLTPAQKGAATKAAKKLKGEANQ